MTQSVSSEIKVNNLPAGYPSNIINNKYFRIIGIIVLVIIICYIGYYFYKKRNNKQNLEKDIQLSEGEFEEPNNFNNNNNVEEEFNENNADENNSVNLQENE